MIAGAIWLIPRPLPSPMHIPDGFLTLMVGGTTWAISIIVLAYAVNRTNRHLEEKRVPLMGVMAAFIFAAQMLNFPVVGGTSGHLIGGALASILLGPWAGVLIMTSVVAIQALVFQDGGLIALGANILNLAVISCLVGYYGYLGMRRLLRQRALVNLVSGFLAAWLSVFVASIAAAAQLSISNVSPLQIALPAMATVHALIGIGEGLITVATLAFIATTRRDLVEPRLTGNSGGAR